MKRNIREIINYELKKPESTSSPAVQREMAQYEQFWTQHEGIISDVSTFVNDIYLKANNQIDGVSSRYGSICAVSFI